MVLNSIITPQMAYAVSDAFADGKAEEMGETKEGETPDEEDTLEIIVENQPTEDNSDDIGLEQTELGQIREERRKDKNPR